MCRWADLTGAERVGVYTRWSLFLLLGAFNAGVLVAVADDEPAALVGFVVTAAAFAVMAPAMRDPSVVPWPRFGVLLLLALAFAVVGVAAWDNDARGAAVMTVMTSLALPAGLLDDRRFPLTVVALSAVLFAISTGDVPKAALGVVFAGAFVASSRLSMWMLGVVEELDNARQAQAGLAVAEERLRFSRDVHDVLGRRLSTIAVQAELAATLADRGDERAAAQMLEVRGVAHEALREARELARGYRTTDFAKELEGARSLLRSAGIEVEVTVDGMPRAWHEPAGWAVRESVTNVLRHSQATVVAITYADETLRVANDGPGAGGGTDGSGLRGLRERLAPLGATLEAGAAGDQWVVTVALPGTGPLSATT